MEHHRQYSRKKFLFFEIWLHRLTKYIIIIFNIQYDQDQKLKILTLVLNSMK